MGDTAARDGTSYIAMAPSVGNAPPGVSWQLLAAAGAIGAVGPQGFPGAGGASGPAGVAGASGPVGPQGLSGAVGPIGPIGPAGVAGAIGAEGPSGLAGPAGMIWRGVWDAATTYAAGDAAARDGTSYIAMAPSVGDAPPGVSWQLLAAAGA